MGIDCNMYFKLKTTQKRAKQIMDDLMNNRDTWLCDMYRRLWRYGYSLNMNDNNEGCVEWSVDIHGYTGKGGIPFEDTARHLLDTYPDVELIGHFDNDTLDLWNGYCKEYYSVDAGCYGYYFECLPDDWEAYFAGDYENTTQGRDVLYWRDRREHPDKYQKENKADNENDDDLPFK